MYGDAHLNTILETESDEVIKSSVEDLVPIPSESEGIFNMCDVPSCDKKHFDAESDLRESLLNRDTLIVYSPKIDSLLEEFAGELTPIHLELIKLIFSDSNNDYTLSDVDSFKDIDYVEASPPDSELVSLEEVEDVILYEKLLNINLLIAKIESLNNNPIPDYVLKPLRIRSYGETRSGSTTYHSDISLPEYDSFHFEIEPDSGDLISSVMDDIFERNEDNYFDPEGGEIDTSPNVDDDHYFPFTFVIRIFLPYLTYPKDFSLLLSYGNEYTIFDPGIFAYIDVLDFEDSRAHGFVHSYTQASYPQLHLGNLISKSY
ncbi:hypothetical protein Tco_0499564 [Tanacetum coccineum]